MDESAAIKRNLPVTNQVHKFKDTDVKRVIKAARAAGLNPVGVEVRVKDGVIRVFGNDVAESTSGSGLDDWMAKHADQAEGR
jgi:hypothetical protein